MSSKIPNLPSKFEIKLTCDPQTILSNFALGAHQQFIIRANGFEIARFMDSESAAEYINHLKATGCHVFTKTIQGRSVIEKIFLMGENHKIKPEIKDGKEMIVRSLDQIDPEKKD